MKQMKTLLMVVVMGLSGLAFEAAWAHGTSPAKHGGVVATAADLSFELASVAGSAVIYVEDHGKPMPPVGLKGKLTILSGGEKTEAELAVAGDKLEAKGVTLAKGAKVVAALTTATGKAITVRFTVK
jgi:hypothetical protein